MSKAYVLLSGGIDSTTCLAIAQEQYGRSYVTAVSLLYGQRHEKEVELARLIADYMGAEWMFRDIKNVIGIGGLTDTGLVIPHVSYAELPEGVSPTYVPFRNGLMLSILASIAAADGEAEVIYYGAHAEDAENDAYPDCSVPFIAAMQEAISIGTYGNIVLSAPLMSITKEQVVRWGDDLNVPWGMTWSCYEGKELHCGECPTCIARIRAFRDAEVHDPTEYEGFIV